MNFSKFVHLLCTRTLYLARGDQFSDQYEGKETEKSRNIRKIVHGDGAYNENTQLYERNRQCVAVNCWSIGKEDTEEMWKRFANGPDGIAVQSNVSRLKKSLRVYPNFPNDLAPEMIAFFDLSFETGYVSAIYLFMKRLNRNGYRANQRDYECNFR